MLMGRAIDSRIKTFDAEIPVLLHIELEVKAIEHNSFNE